MRVSGRGAARSVNIGSVLLTAGLAPTPEWGSMIAMGSQNIVTGQWWPSGQYAVQGVLNADVNPVLGFVVFSAVLSLIIYLVVDLIYFALDPRTRG
jgi:hypothetical protein